MHLKSAKKFLKAQNINNFENPQFDMACSYWLLIANIAISHKTRAMQHTIVISENPLFSLFLIGFFTSMLLLLLLFSYQFLYVCRVLLLYISYISPHQLVDIARLSESSKIHNIAAYCNQQDNTNRCHQYSYEEHSHFLLTLFCQYI